MANLTKPNINDKSWTILKILNWTQSYFKNHSIDSPRLTAEILLAHSLGIKRLDLYLQYDRPLEQRELSGFKTLIKRRIQHEPVAYITGVKGFYESEFHVTPDVLIPRPDTELMVEQALAVLNNRKDEKNPQKVLEMGTGSGAIIVSLAKAASQHLYFATDKSVQAIGVAKKNADRVLSCPAIEFCVGSWFSMFSSSQSFDLIVSNPPYIPSQQIGMLQPEIRQYEPRLALDGGRDGLACYRWIIERAVGFLCPGGVMLLEIGSDQKEDICRIMTESSLYYPPEFMPDLAGHDRLVLIKKHH